MVKVAFTPNLEKHLAVPELEAQGSTIGEILQSCCLQNPALQSYILDDQGGVRKHVAVFIDGIIIRDKSGLSDPVKESSKVFVMQALSGG